MYNAQTNYSTYIFIRIKEFYRSRNSLIKVYYLNIFSLIFDSFGYLYDPGINGSKVNLCDLFI